MGSHGELAFQHIGLQGFSVGVLTLKGESIVWSDRHGHQTKSIKPNDILRTTWAVFGPSGHLRVFAKDGKHHRFEGFRPQDKESVKDFMRSAYEINLKDDTVSSDGANFGSFQFKDKSLVFDVGDKNAFELSLANISQCVIPGNTRNEVELQFHESDAVDREEDTLVEIRFHFPAAEDKEIETTAAEEFQQSVMEVANIRSVTGEVIVEFDPEQGTFLTPRGRYTIEMYATFMRMHGAKYDYKIQYDDIDRLFLLPKPNDIHVAFVISLDKPLRQGQQRYHHLVLQSHKQDAHVTVNLSQDDLQGRYEGQLQEEMTGPLSNILAKVFKVLSGKKVFIPGNFRSDKGAHAVKCALRANEGLLYPLEKSFIFIHKPPVLLKFTDIESVDFQRYSGAAAGAATRNFDLSVMLKTAVGDQPKEYTFAGIDRAEYKKLYEFLSSKQLRIKNIQDDGRTQSSLLQEIDQQMTAEGYDDEGSEEDESYNGGSGSEGSDQEGSGSESEGSDEGGYVEESPRKAEKKSAKKSEKKAPKEPVKAKKAPAATPTKKRAAPAARDDSDDGEDDEDKDEAPAKKGRKKKDPNAPKGAKSSYAYFQQSMRQTISQQNPGKSFGEISRLVSDRWKSLSSEEKEQYEELSREDKKRFRDEMANYDGPATTVADDESKTKKKRQKKDPNAPKKAMTSYLAYSNEQRPLIKQEQPSLSMTEISKVIGQRWKALSSEEQEPYKLIAKRDKERYDRDMQSYAPGATSSSSTSKPKKAKAVVKSQPKVKAEEVEDEDADDDAEEESAAGSDDEEDENDVEDDEEDEDDAENDEDDG